MRKTSGIEEAKFTYISAMEMFCMLLSDAGDILIALMGRWLILKEILRLDSALCNRKLRADFTAHVSSLHFDAQPTKNSVICKYFDWMIRRKIPIRSINVQNALENVIRCPTRNPISMITIIRNLFRPKQIFMCEWLQTVLLQCSTTLLKLSITTEPEKNAFTTEVFAAIGSCSHLRALYLTQCQFSYPTMFAALTPIILGCQRLEELALHGCWFTEHDAEQISRRLRIFDFSTQYPPFLTARVLPKLVTRCTALTKLHVWDANWTHAATALFSADMLAQNCPRLLDLDVNTMSVNCTALVNMLHACKHLHTVKLHLCNDMNESAFTALVLHSSITHLELDNNTTLTGQLDVSQTDTKTLHTHSVLQYLQLHRFPALSDEGLASLLRRCPALESLRIGRSPRLSVAVVDAMVQHCPNINQMAFGRSLLLTHQIVQARLRELGTGSGISIWCINV